MKLSYRPSVPAADAGRSLPTARPRSRVGPRVHSSVPLLALEAAESLLRLRQRCRKPVICLLQEVPLPSEASRVKLVKKSGQTEVLTADIAHTCV